MNKKEWKANYTAARIIHSGLVKMMMMNNKNSNNTKNLDTAIRAVWQSIDKLEMGDVIFGGIKRDTHNIRVHKWAVKTNHQGQ